MNSILHKPDSDKLITRVRSLNESSVAQWGKMNVYQMMQHCIKWDEMAQGKTKYKRTFIGMLFGKSALKEFIKDEKYFKQSVPTHPALKIKETTGDFLTLQSNWITLIEDYSRFSNDKFIHPFFGEMTKEQLGILAYKHTDHHVRQFGA